MKSIVRALAVCLTLLSPASGQALTNAEFKQLMQYPEFRAADQELGRVWKDVYGSRTGQARKDLLKEQRQWLKEGRDRTAEDYMQFAGMDIVQAYTRAVQDRIDALQGTSFQEPPAVAVSMDDIYRQQYESVPNASSNDFVRAIASGNLYDAERLLNKSVLSTKGEVEHEDMSPFSRFFDPELWQTPLRMATLREGKKAIIEVIRRLFRMGARVNEAALEVAGELGSPELMQLLSANAR